MCRGPTAARIAREPVIKQFALIVYDSRALQQRISSWISSHSGEVKTADCLQAVTTGSESVSAVVRAMETLDAALQDAVLDLEDEISYGALPAAFE